MSGSSEGSPHRDRDDFTTAMIRAICRRSIVAGLILVIQLWAPGSRMAFANDPSLAEPQVQIGWDNSYLVGRWTQALVDVDIPVPGEYQVRVTAPDPDGHRVTYSGPARDLPQGRTQITGFFKVGRLNAEIDVQIVAVANGKAIARWNSLNLAHPLAPITPQSRLIVTTGSPSGFDAERHSGSAESGSHSPTGAAGTDTSSFLTVPTNVEQLPADAVAYDGVTLVVIAGPSVVSVAQSNALRDWVAGGGRLLISLPANLKTTKEIIDPLASWLPATVGNDEVTVRNFGKLEFYAGRNVRIPFFDRMSVPSVKINQGEYLAGGREDALLVRSPYGMGSVTILALDLTVPPLSQWSEVTSLCRRLAQSSGEADATRRTSKSLQLSSTGVSDFATQIHAIQEDFAEVTRASPWFVMGSLGLLLLVIGPLDYLIVLRVLKLPRSTWVTLPLWIILGTVLSSYLAVRWNGTSQQINQLNLINVDVATSTCHQKLWTDVYSPVMVRKSVSVRSAVPSAAAPADDAVYSSWSGVPESSFGGMLRPAGLDIARSDYRQTVDGRLEGLPFVQWSSKPFLTEIHSHADRLVECDLQANSGGRLSGSLIHRFAGPIEDWVLVHGNRVYRQMKQREDNSTLPLAAQQYWRVDQPNVYQRELRAFLTGEIALSKKRDGTVVTDVVHRNVEYDPLSRDPATVLRTLTFYHDAGGQGYTGLANNLLESEDLSHLLKLGRAVLFGRLNHSTAVVRVDGQIVAPSRESTFVRLVLPVRKATTDAPPELERLTQ